jgi:hypothetical protein
MNRVRWTISIVAVFLAVTVIALLSRKGQVGSAGEEASKASPVALAQPEVAPLTRTVAAQAPNTSAGTLDPGSLQAVGTLAGAHYFQTYLNIGFIAEGKEKGTYSHADARKVLRYVLSVVDSVDRQLAALGSRNLGKEDRDSLEQMQAISAMLRQQGADLQTYWDTSQQQHAARYESIRRTSYATISKLLAIP